MSVKHVPTIALPWVQHEQGDANSYVLLKADGKTWVVAFLLNGEQTTEAQRQNAAYIVHACNSYPELVGEIRAWLPVNPADDGSQDAAMRALLTKLGEAKP